MGCLRVCACYSRSATCICAVVVIHVILVVTLVAALFTRFFVYSPDVHGDMPSDQRLLLRESSSIFCSKHVVKSFMLDGRFSTPMPEHDELYSNSQPEFDLYTFKDDPRHMNLSIKTRKVSLLSTSSLLYQEHDFHHFNMMENTKMNFSICSEYATRQGTSPRKMSEIGLYVYFFQGDSQFKDALKSMTDKHWTVPCNSMKTCPLYVRSPPQRLYGCERMSPTDFTQFSTQVNTSDDYYVVLYNPDNNHFGQKYVLKYALTRSQYDLGKFEPSDKDTRDAKVKPDNYILLAFNTWLNSSTNNLNTIRVEYTCQSDVLVYMGIFFFIPLLLLVGLCGLLYYCYERRVASYEPARIQWEDDMNQGRSYGSTEPIYT